MANTGRITKEWLPAIGALFAVIAAVGYAVSRTTTVSEEIRGMDELAATLSSKAIDVKAGVRSKEELEQLQKAQIDFEMRTADAGKPGLVVSQLSEAARSAGLQVLEIQPLAASPMARAAAGADPGAILLPNYRVSLKGTYQQIATYMKDCTTQRVPVRVVGFEIGQFDETSQSAGAALRADIIVESYQPRRRAAEANPGA